MNTQHDKTRTTKPLVPHPAMLDDQALLKQCDQRFGRSAGPGGQHRNKVETAATLKHKLTGIEASAFERRSQTENRAQAMRRLRLKLACEFRRHVNPDRYQPSALWESRRQGRQISINPKHRDYPALLAEALDIVHASHFDVAGAAGVLGITMSQLAKLIRHSKQAFTVVNEGRTNRGLHALR